MADSQRRNPITMPCSTGTPDVDVVATSYVRTSRTSNLPGVLRRNVNTGAGFGRTQIMTHTMPLCPLYFDLVLRPSPSTLDRYARLLVPRSLRYDSRPIEHRKRSISSSVSSRRPGLFATSGPPGRGAARWRRLPGVPPGRPAGSGAPGCRARTQQRWRRPANADRHYR